MKETTAVLAVEFKDFHREGSTGMHVLCFDCALSASHDDDRAHAAVPVINGMACPVCGSENPFDLEGIAFDGRQPSGSAVAL